MLGWELPPHNSGGLGVACLNMAKALAEKGANIDFAVPYSAPHPGTKFMQVVSTTKHEPFYHLANGSYESIKLFDEFIPNFDNNTYTSIRNIQKEYCNYIDDYLETHHFDIVHAHDWLTYEAGILAKKKYNIPLIAHVHATEFDRSGMQTGNPLIHEIEYEGLMMADRIIAVSESTKHIIHKKYKIPLSKIEVIYNSLDLDYEKNDYSFDENIYNYIKSLKKKGYIVVSTVGRFTIQKGLQNLMHAAATAISKNPKFIFIFAGDGEERNDLVRLAANLGISKNVIFTGFIRGKKLRDVYTISDVFVMSSISEPFGLTALEAAHHNNVLILTRQSGVSEIIWSALKYNFWDQKKLADDLIAIASNPTLRKTLQNNVKQEYCKISWDQVAKKCLNIYNKTIKTQE